MYVNNNTSRAELFMTETPAPTKTWRPVPHYAVLEALEGALEKQGYRVTSEQHELTGSKPDRKTDRYFGLLTLDDGCDGEGTVLQAGLRNCHDKLFALGLAIGNQVEVCSNLSFWGETQIARKHTSLILSDLPVACGVLVSKIATERVNQLSLMRRYKSTRISDRDASHLMVNAIDKGVLPASKLPALLKEWREPRYPDFKERNLWSLYNGFTQVFKSYRQSELIARSTNLHNVMALAV